MNFEELMHKSEQIPHDDTRRIQAALQLSQPDTFVPGLPRGVRAIRYGMAGQGDKYVMWGSALATVDSVNANECTNLIVEPAPGYAFVRDPDGRGGIGLAVRIVVMAERGVELYLGVE